MAILRGIADFVRGFMFLPKGARFLARHPSLWKGVVAPLLVNVFGFSASLYWSFSTLTEFVDSLLRQQGWFWTAVGFLGKIFAFGLSMAAAVVVFLVIATLLSGPFNDWLGAKTLKILGQESAHSDASVARSVAALLRATAESVKEVGYFLAISGILFALGWIPVIGLIAPIIGVPFLWYCFAFEAVTPCLSERELSFREKRSLLAGNRWAVFGFGCACFLLLLIPLAGFFLLPVAVVGGALLYHERLRVGSNRPEQAGGDFE